MSTTFILDIPKWDKPSCTFPIRFLVVSQFKMQTIPNLRTNFLQFDEEMRRFTLAHNRCINADMLTELVRGTNLLMRYSANTIIFT